MRGTGTRYETYFDTLDQWWPGWGDWEQGYERIPLGWPDYNYSDWRDGT